MNARTPLTSWNVYLVFLTIFLTELFFMLVYGLTSIFQLPYVVSWLLLVFGGVSIWCLFMSIQHKAIASLAYSFVVGVALNYMLTNQISFDFDTFQMFTCFIAYLALWLLVDIVICQFGDKGEYYHEVYPF
jgi:hypothetical protein